MRPQGTDAFLHGVGHSTDGGTGLGGVEQGRPGLDPVGRVVVQGVDDAHGHVEVALEVARLLPELGARRAGGVHVVQEQHARHPQLPHLQDQEQLALQRAGVRNEHDHVGPVRVAWIEQRALGDAAVVALGVQVVDAGQVVKRPRLPALVLARGHGGVHGDARQVAHRHRPASESLKHGGFTRVGVADERQFHGCKGRG